MYQIAKENGYWIRKIKDKVKWKLQTACLRNNNNYTQKLNHR